MASGSGERPDAGIVRAGRTRFRARSGSRDDGKMAGGQKSSAQSGGGFAGTSEYAAVLAQVAREVLCRFLSRKSEPVFPPRLTRLIPHEAEAPPPGD